MAALAFAGALAIAPVISGCGAGSEPQTAAPTQLTDAVNVSVPKDHPKIDVRNLFLLGPQPGQKLAAGASVPLYATIINQVKGQADKLVAVRAAGFADVKISGGGLALPAAQPDGTGTATRLLGSASPEPSASPSKKDKKDKAGASASPSASPEITGAGATPSGEPAPHGSATAASSNTPSPNTAGGGNAATPQPSGGQQSPLVVLTGLDRELIGGETVQVTLQFASAGSTTVSVPVIPQQGEYATYPPAPGASASPAASPSESGTATPSAGESGTASPEPTASRDGASPSTTPTTGG
ncbi:hypothetical protein [Actinomadura parmotrematis]|uniref:Copper chaperone PCu(A)C n=1 Tax=Actinomadura parmotrematis TaxID=2864039 RepID=A0ABS7FY81_9ACTN|nr:hypothetical protein [Actinomadura parmotrematis]MBW8485389.1 hypothetical protein [Actinomadura parmotrematis]